MWSVLFGNLFNSEVRQLLLDNPCSKRLQAEAIRVDIGGKSTNLKTMIKFVENQVKLRQKYSDYYCSNISNFNQFYICNFMDGIDFPTQILTEENMVLYLEQHIRYTIPDSIYILRSRVKELQVKLKYLEMNLKRQNFSIDKYDVLEDTSITNTNILVELAYLYLRNCHVKNNLSQVLKDRLELTNLYVIITSAFLDFNFILAVALRESIDQNSEIKEKFENFHSDILNRTTFRIRITIFKLQSMFPSISFDLNTIGEYFKENEVNIENATANDLFSLWHLVKQDFITSKLWNSIVDLYLLDKLMLNESFYALYFCKHYFECCSIAKVLVYELN